MDAWLIVLRLLHVGGAMAWFGGAVVGGFFLQPTAAALGATGQPFMEHLMRRRKMGIYFPIVATVTIVAGAFLYWRDSAGLELAWVTSPVGLGFTVGAIAAVVAWAGGFILIGPSIATQARVQRELAQTGAPPNEEQQRRLASAEARLRLANRLDLPLLLLAGLSMAVARYL